MRFQHPGNGYVETCSAPFLWALLFGPFYFVLKGVWRHVVLYFAVNSLVLTAWSILGTSAILASPYMLQASGISNPNDIANALAIAGVVLALSLVLPFLIYPFLAAGIVRRHFLRQGWTEVA
jgi:hypothetical protein